MTPQSVDACEIALNSSLHFRTSYGNGGIQPDGWFVDENPPFVYVDFKTIGCEPTTDVYLTIFGLLDDGGVAKTIYNYQINLGGLDETGGMTIPFRADEGPCYANNEDMNGHDCLIFGMFTDLPMSNPNSQIMGVIGDLVGSIPTDQGQIFANTFGGQEGGANPTTVCVPIQGRIYMTSANCNPETYWGFHNVPLAYKLFSPGNANEKLITYYNTYYAALLGNLSLVNAYSTEGLNQNANVDNQPPAATLAYPALKFNCESACAYNDEWTIADGVLPYGGVHPQDQGTVAVGPLIDAYQDVYKPLAPLPFPGLNGGATPSLGEYLASIFKAAIIIVIVLSVIMISFNGVAYMLSGTVGKKMELRDTVSNAVIGLLIALGSWLLLNTINPNLASNLSISIPNVSLDLDGEDPAWQGGSADDGTLLCKSKKYHHKLNGQSIVKGVTQWPPDGVQRNFLLSSGISVDPTNNCEGTGYPGGCTSVYFPNTNNVTERLAQMKQACDSATDNGSCSIVITGGSECWLHSSHGPDKKTVDIRSSDANFNAWVVDNASSITGKGRNVEPKSNGFPDNGKNYIVPGYGKFKAEYEGQYAGTSAEHWHVTFD